MPFYGDPAGDATALFQAADKLDAGMAKSPRWQDWRITGPASEHKAAMARFRQDHPQENLPWGYCPP